ncbi:MAG: glycoside hydrolase [Acidobacteria bacterium]|nr:glycoside hydrolase [Acidobacteriota bacterium]
MTKVAIVWHMHQPFYEDLVTHEHILPWVRLHAIKDYYGMVAILREFPDVRMTFNLVPSLLIQLEAFAADRARDHDLELSLKPAVDLTEGDIDFILENFFHAQRVRMIEAHPRYAELLARRGAGPQTPGDRRAAARRFNAYDLRDLQVWHKLAWIDPGYLEEDARVRSLVGKGREFTEADKSLLGEVELELLNRVIPEYGEAARRGQIEISTSPFFHPVLPLLCDSDVYLRTHPDSRMPRQRFQHPEDAAEQLERAAAYHERLFGRRPIGLWPSEGSVSDQMVPLVAAAGFTWMATDELILARTLGMTFSRDAQGHIEQADRLYHPYAVNVAGTSVACAFRDHGLSDLIGFHYAGWSTDAAAGDFVGRLVEAGRRYREQTGGGEATVPIILDGENAWEHFEGGGRPFLRALYRRLSDHSELRTVTMAEACAGSHQTLDTIFPGSWIDANFYIWIGHADDHRAWSQLADARQAFERATVDPARRAEAHEEILVAEGSDWFWWYGDDHSSDHDLKFDDLFRRHLRNVYRLLELPVPEELFVSNITTGAAPATELAPVGRVNPKLDGEETSYFEWMGAGLLEIRDVAGAMHQADRQASLLTLVHFGFGAGHFHLRLDATRRLADLLAEGHQCTVTFLQPPGSSVLVRQIGGRVEADWHGLSADGILAAAGRILEVSIPLPVLERAPGEPVAFFVALLDPTGRELERHPGYRPIEAAAPLGGA